MSSNIKRLTYLLKSRYYFAEELFGVSIDILEECRKLGCNILINTQMKYFLSAKSQQESHLHISFIQISKKNKILPKIYYDLLKMNNCRKSEVEQFITLIFHKASFLNIHINLLERHNEQEISRSTKRKSLRTQST